MMGQVYDSCRKEFPAPPVLRGRVGVGAERRMTREKTPTLSLPRSTGGGDKKIILSKSSRRSCGIYRLTSIRKCVEKIVCVVAVCGEDYSRRRGGKRFGPLRHEDTKRTPTFETISADEAFSINFF